MGKNIYIGFSIDMDSAFPSSINIIKNKEPSNKFINFLYQDNKENFKNGLIFEEGMNNIIKFFFTNNYMSGATWLINEANYDTSILYPDIIKKLYEYVEKYNCAIGLHTHFEADMFKMDKETLEIEKKWKTFPAVPGVTTGGYFEVSNKEMWYNEGLINPKKRIEECIFKMTNKIYNINCFKSGSHILNYDIISSIIDTNFIVDCSMVYETKRVLKLNDTENFTMYNNEKIKFDDGPFYINNKILEIPECANLGLLKNKIKLLKNKKNIYLLLQLHPYQCIKSLGENNLLNNILKYINLIRKNYDNTNIKFVNMLEMKNIIDKNNDYHHKDINDVIKLI